MIRWPMLLDEHEAQFCEDDDMPDIMPAKGDVVAVGNLLAEIGSKTPSGDFEVVLTAEPMFRATIKIADFDWSYELRQWVRRMIPATEAQQVTGIRHQPRAVVELPS